MPGRTKVSRSAPKRKQEEDVHLPPAKKAAITKAPEPEERSDFQKWRDSIPETFKNVSNYFSAIRRPYQTGTGNGTYVAEEDKGSLLGALTDLNLDNVDALFDTLRATVSKEPWDDREYLMERVIKAAAKLPSNKNPSKHLTGLLIQRLWNDLQHPVPATLGKQSQYRSADGSGNNPQFPDLGKAGQPYARSVNPKTQQLAALPEPGVIFDSIMSRSIDEKHPNEISSMLFYVASIIIHDAFRTNRRDANISDSSSYLDLSPLYGCNAQEQKMMRTHKDGRIKPDCFSERRLQAFPPGVGALLIMFNRFHNHVVETLADINEGGRFDKPHPPVPGSHRPGKTEEQYDEDLFQTGRLVTCGLYINIVLVDYVRTILNLQRTDSDWALDPRVDMVDGPALGVGNQVSAEFNLCYRWHSCISSRDTKWTEELYAKIFKTTDYEGLPMDEFLMGLGKFENSIPDDPAQRSLEDFVRGEDGKFSDDDLVEVLTSSIEDCAHSFGPRRVPAVMRAVEIMGIRQARQWNVCTLNEFREFFNLKRYHSFDEITSDEYVADQLRHLYDVPDNVELYPGIVCEDAKRPELPGSGLMAPYTTSRAILSDAVALTRGDRYYTTDYNSKNLTSWGFSEVASDKKLNNGCVFYKLFYTAFPNHFRYNSVYAHFPLTVPTAMEETLTELEKAADFNFERPGRQIRPQPVTSYKACVEILEDKETFGVTWGPAMEFLMGPEAKDFMLAGDAGPNVESREMMGKALYVDGWTQSVRDFYAAKTRQLLALKSYRIAGVNQVDVIRDISNLVHVHFCAELFMLPLKSHEHPHGLFTEHELYLIMAGVFTCVFFDADPEHSFEIHQVSREATRILGDRVQQNVASIKRSGVFAPLFAYLADHNRDSPLQHYGVHMIERLLASGMDVKRLVWGHIMGTAGGMVPNQGQLFAQMLEYYFTEGKEHWPDIARWARLEGPEADETLMRYIMEGSRIYCSSAVTRSVRRDVTLHDGGRTLHLKEGDELFLSFYAASRDPSVFPHPQKVDLTRSLDAYLQLGWGPHQCLGLRMTRVALTAVLREMAKLPNLRPVDGPQGRVAKTKSGVEGYWKYLTETANGFFPFPVSMKVTWDRSDDDEKEATTNGHVSSNGHR